jgi:Concanavalin A-like lectin/glucanases superfamily/Trehalose utilisation
MKSAILVLFLLSQFAVKASQASDKWLTLEGKEGIGKGQHIVFVTGEEYYRSEEGMSMFAQILSERHGYKCTVLFAIDPNTGTINPNRNSHIPGLDSLQSADLMVIFARFRELPDEDMKHIVDYVNTGKPVLGIRNATHAFRYSPNSTSRYKNWDFQNREWEGGFGQQILGDTWIAHYGKFQKEATLAHKNMKHSNHPVLRGVSDKLFVHTDVNSVERLKKDDTVLFHGQVLSGLNPNDPPVADDRKDVRMPFAWFKTYAAPSGKQGRSFTTTAGASLDWLNEDLRRMMVNAVFSLTGHERDIPAKTNVEFVDSYSPKPTGSLSDQEWADAKLTPARWNRAVPAPIAYWKLDDIGQQAVDSAAGHHGVIHGATSREGKAGKGLLFDRQKGDHVSIPYSPDFDIGTYTASAWVWLTKEPTFSGILGTRHGGEFNFDMKVNADKVHGDIGDGTRWIDTAINFYRNDLGTNGQGGDLEIKRWYLVTFVIDNEKKNCRLYLDGDLKKTITFTGEPRLMRQGQAMHIGNTGANEFMDGVIDEVRLWNKALTDEQVKKLLIK